MIVIHVDDFPVHSYEIWWPDRAESVLPNLAEARLLTVRSCSSEVADALGPTSLAARLP